MAGDRASKNSEPVMTPKVWAGIAVGSILLVVMIWAWWPTPAPTIDPNVKKAQDALNDSAANPPVADVPPPTDGPRRKAIKGR